MKKVIVFISVLAVFFIVGCKEDTKNLVKEEDIKEEMTKCGIKSDNVYCNEKYYFKAAILTGFDVEYLDDESGIYLTRTVSGDELKKMVDEEMKIWPKGTKDKPLDQPYKVRITISVVENVFDFKDLGEYMRKECVDCNKEFFMDGVYIDKDMAQFAERDFLFMSKNKKYLFNASLTVPRSRFFYHKKELDEFVSSIEFL